MTLSRQIHLVRRPDAVLRPEDFTIAEVELPDLKDEQLLVRNTHLSVDPYMRRRMDEGKSYIPPFELNKAMAGGAVGEVIASTSKNFAVGDWVLHDLGWRDVAAVHARFATPLDVSVVPASAYLGIIGMPGMTAWSGLLKVSGYQPGDTVFVSGAAGAVGSAVGQIAKIHGSRVIGSTGSDSKAEWLRELGFDEVINYRNGPVLEQLRAVAPEGIDVYFDNVGYEHLEAALDVASDFARVVVCGSIADYNSEEVPPGPRNLFWLVAKRITMRGFIVSDQYEHFPEFIKDMSGWLATGKIQYQETIVEGLENTVSAMEGLFSGANTGKMIVKL